jgi:hypothetical protein
VHEHRRKIVAAVCAVGATVLAGVASAQEPPPAPATMEGATITDAGWWNRLRPQVDLPTGQPAAPPTPGVPAGSLVVGATGGEPDAVAAVNLDPDADEGATVESFVLTLREVTAEGANLNTSAAAIVACPATGFWVGGENGVWETQPERDCSLGEAPGARAEDGTWTFDLTAIAQQWVDGTIADEGVVLVEAVEPPSGFRTVFEGLASQQIGVQATSSGGEEPADDPFESGGGTTSGGSTSGGGGFTTGGGSSTGGGFTPPATSGPPAGGTAAPAAPPVATPAVEPADLPTVPISESVPGFQWWMVPLAIVALGVALLAMLALGPAGEPATVSAARGVTRAIEARLFREEP